MKIQKSNSAKIKFQLILKFFLVALCLSKPVIVLAQINTWDGLVGGTSPCATCNGPMGYYYWAGGIFDDTVFVPGNAVNDIVIADNVTIDLDPLVAAGFILPLVVPRNRKNSGRNLFCNSYYRGENGITKQTCIDKINKWERCLEICSASSFP